MKASVLIFSLALFLTTNNSVAQNQNKLKAWENVVSRFLNSYNNKFKSDSVSFYAFVVKVDFKKIKGKYFVSNFKLSDSIGFKMFSNIDSVLRSIDFNIFIEKQPSAKLIIHINTFLRYFCS